MNTALVMILMLAIPLVYVLIWYVTVKKKRQQSYSIKRHVGLLSITFTLIATEFGGELVLGTSDEAYSSGLYGILYIIGICLGFLLLGFGFAEKMKALNVSSSVDIFSLKYNSSILKLIASVLSILTLCGLLLGQVVACKTLLMSLGISHHVIVIGFWLLTCLYAVTGGISGAGLTNTFQLTYVMVTFTGIFLYCLFQEPHSIFAITNFIEGQRLLGSPHFSLSNFFTSLIMPALYCLIEQDYAQPLFAARNKRTAIYSAVTASFFMLLFSLVPLYFGIKAKLLNITLQDGASPLLPVLHILTNQYIVLIALCGLITAIIATTDYLLWSLSMSLSECVIAPGVAAPVKKKWEQHMACLVGVGILLLSYATHFSTITILNVSFELYDCCLVIPLLMTYFKQELRKSAAIGSITGGIIGLIIFHLVPTGFPTDLAALLLSLAGYIAGEYGEIFYLKLVYRRSRSFFVSG